LWDGLREDEMRCPKCGTVNSEDSKFCKECGTLLIAGEKPLPEEVAGKRQRGLIRQTKKPFVIYAVLGAVGLIVLVVAYGMYSQSAKEQASSLKLSVSQEKVYIVTMSSYICPCGSCGDQILIDCDCALALKVQREVRQRLAWGATSEEIVRLLENVYRAKKVTS